MSAELDMLSQEEIEAVAVFLIRELESTDKSHSLGESFETPEYKQPFEQVEDDETESLTMQKKTLSGKWCAACMRKRQLSEKLFKRCTRKRKMTGFYTGYPARKWSF